MAEPQMTADLQEKLQRLQSMGEQVQAAGQQRQQMEALRSEAKRALEAIGEVADDAPIYRNLGGLMMREKGKAEVEARLTDDVETFDVRIERLKKQEAQMRESLQELQEELQAAFGAASGA